MLQHLQAFLVWVLLAKLEKLHKISAHALTKQNSTKNHVCEIPVPHRSGMPGCRVIIVSNQLLGYIKVSCGIVGVSATYCVLVK